MESINFNQMLEKSKRRLSIETKQIKKMSLYNYFNDGVPNLIIDCRSNMESRVLEEVGRLRDSFIIKNFPYNNIQLSGPSRLTVILDEDQDLKTGEEFAKLRTFIRNEDKLEKGLFAIKDNEYIKFLKDYSCFFINENKDDNLAKQIAKTTFPLLVLDNLIYVGNFFNSKNLHQLKILKIASIISLLKEEDHELNKVYNNMHFILTDEENHAEIDFLYLIDLIESEREAGNVPILIYCFSGQTVSLAVCIAYLMKSKKWSLEFATAYMMKICPNFKISAWLYSQLQRLDLKSNSKKANILDS